MTPAARVAAAIDIIDEIGAGAPAERALTNWARRHRFAGSKDRAAIRDHVFDVLRCKGSCARLGVVEPEAADGRALMLGLMRLQGQDPMAIFSGERFAPAPLGPQERALFDEPVPEALARLDWPAWLRASLEARLGGDFDAISDAMRARAPVFVRVNLAKTCRDAARAALAEDGIAAETHPLADTALELGAGARRIQQARAYTEGLVELQDVSSQAAVAELALSAGQSALDYCAGGGGKALALAARCAGAEIWAHDVDAGRMSDLPARAARAGARIGLRAPGDPGAGYDLVLVDAPCSGSGTWRRTPDAKWRLTPERLAELTDLQARILAEAAACVAPGGELAYMTCSLLGAENEAQIEAFARQSGWRCLAQRSFTPLSGGDGFFVARMRRAAECAD